MSKNLSRIALALLVLATLATGAAQAAPVASTDTEMSPLGALWEWVASWFELSTVDEGCGMDPNGGGCRNGATGDEGPGMDPNG
jgi:hypothetical protein